MRRSVATILSETAQRLAATPESEPDAELKRAIGRSLAGSEALRFGFLPEDRPKKRYRQGLELTLGFYDPRDRQIIDNPLNEETAANAFSVTLGGWTSAVQLHTTLIDPNDPNWLLAPYENPRPKTTQHLHRVILQLRHELEVKSRSKRPPLLYDNNMLLIARHLRFRLSVDHSNPKTTRRDVLIWGTPIVDVWLSQCGGSWVTLQKLTHLLGPLIAQGGADADHARGHQDDWGDVDLTFDPLRVARLGPRTDDAETHKDVEMVLGRAGNQLSCNGPRLDNQRRSSRDPLSRYILGLTELALDKDLADRLDVVLVYRGGGMSNIGNPDRVLLAGSKAQLLEAAKAVAELGVEVVMGLGHGNVSVLPDSCIVPIGVHEAATPTAAAEWVLREHVNTRLVNAVPDLGMQGC